MSVDNAIYDRMRHTWWDEDGMLNGLRSALNPARFGYMRRVLVDGLRCDPRGLRVLDVGCGGGLLAEEFARLGCEVVGVDPSEGSLEVARDHARDQDLEIDYIRARGEQLPFGDREFGMVYCCDVLEHVDDVAATMTEAARVLEDGGVFLYDTINRTLRSWLGMIKVVQDWPLTRCAEPGLHDWRAFIRPAELEGQLRAAGLVVGDRVGIAPANPAAVIAAMRARARGEISYAEMGGRMRLRESRDTSIFYAGFALKPMTPNAARPSRSSDRKQHAQEMFSALPRRYTLAGATMSLGQDPRWRRAMLDALDDPPRLGPQSRVLDVASGTGLVAAQLVRRTGCSVVALDQNGPMLAGARARFARDPSLAPRVAVVAGEAERLPFPDNEFDALTFTYLLRYVDDPQATLHELARVVKPGGRVASLEFAVPERRVLRGIWWLHTRAGLPLVGALISRDWADAGRFLGPSITSFYRCHPLERVLEYWRAAGLTVCTVRRMSLGAGVVIAGVRDDRDV